MFFSIYVQVPEWFQLHRTENNEIMNHEVNPLIVNHEMFPWDVPIYLWVFLFTCYAWVLHIQLISCNILQSNLAMEKPVFIHKIAAFSLIFLWQRFAFLGIEIGAKSTLAHFGSFCSMFFTQTSRQIAEKKSRLPQHCRFWHGLKTARSSIESECLKMHFNTKTSKELIEITTACIWHNAGRLCWALHWPCRPPGSHLPGDWIDVKAQEQKWESGTMLEKNETNCHYQ